MERYCMRWLMRNAVLTADADYETIEEAMLFVLDLMDSGEAIGWCLFDFYDAHQKETDYKSLYEYPVIAQSQNWHSLI